MFKNFDVDTTLPTITTLLNQSLSNSSINISAVIGDIYLNGGNFSHNATGTWQNSSFSSKGNTTYEFIIPYSSITLDREVSWMIYSYDEAGNEIQSLVSSFTIASTTPAAQSAPTTGGAGGGGIFGRCDPLSQAYGTCYFYDGTTSSCVKGCPSGFSCNKEELKCAETSPTSTSITNPLTAKASLWQRFKTFMGLLFSTQLEGLEAIPLQEKNSQPIPSKTAGESSPISSLPPDAPIQAVLANPIQALMIIGIIGTIIAGITIQWLLIAPPAVFFLIAYWAIVALLWKFKIFGG